MIRQWLAKRVRIVREYFDPPPRPCDQETIDALVRESTQKGDEAALSQPGSRLREPTDGELRAMARERGHDHPR